MWNKAYGLETANSEGDSPAFHWGECVRPQHLTQTKCEQICARKREITPAHSKPLALRWCQTQRILHSHARKETEWCMYGEREVEEVGRGERKKKKKIKEKYLASRFTTVVKCFQCCSGRSGSSKCFEPEAWQRRKGGRGGAGVGRGGAQNGFMTLVIKSK